MIARKQEISVDRIDLLLYRRFVVLPARGGGDPAIPRSCDSVILRSYEPACEQRSMFKVKRLSWFSLGVDR